MRVIVTGAEGNLGRRITEQPNFQGLSIGRAGWDQLNMIQHGEYHAFIHCAYDLKTNINISPVQVLDSNIQSTARALELCRKKLIKKFVFISSCSVYGHSSDTFENNLCYPVTSNGRTKLFNEELVKLFCEANDIGYLILRVFNSYGGEDNFSVVARLISCAKENRPFKLVNGGQAQRDFINVIDVARCIFELTMMGVINDVINVGSGRSVRVIDLLRSVEEVYGPIDVIPAKRDDEVIYSCARIDKLLRLIQLRPTDVMEFIHGIKR